MEPTPNPFARVPKSEGLNSAAKQRISRVMEEDNAYTHGNRSIQDLDAWHKKTGLAIPMSGDALARSDYKNRMTERSLSKSDRDPYSPDPRKAGPSGKMKGKL